MNCAKCNFPHPPCELIDGLCHRCTANKSSELEAMLRDIVARIHHDNGECLEGQLIERVVHDSHSIVAALHVLLDTCQKYRAAVELKSDTVTPT
jgi:hypothetical protein